MRSEHKDYRKMNNSVSLPNHFYSLTELSMSEKIDRLKGALTKNPKPPQICELSTFSICRSLSMANVPDFFSHFGTGTVTPSHVPRGICILKELVDLQGPGPVNKLC